MYRTLRKVPGTNTKKVYVVTPRCATAAAAVVSAVVLRRPTKEYTHPYSMMHRRLTAAGTEHAPYYHQLLVILLRHWEQERKRHWENREVIKWVHHCSRKQQEIALVTLKRDCVQQGFFDYLVVSAR